MTHNAENDADEWTCSMPGCDLDIDAHDFALALEHIFHDEPNFTAEDARDVADRTLDKVARAFGVDDEARVIPPAEKDGPGAGNRSCLDNGSARLLGADTAYSTRPIPPADGGAR